MSVENIVVDIEINNSIVPDIEQSIVATIDNNINVIKDDTDDLDVTINRKEYVITGDEIYIPKRYEDAPTWLQNMIDQVVKYSIGAKVSDMNQVVYSLNQMIEAMEVSKNTYEMSVISSNDIDTRINTAITTLNSNMNDADATILSVANTKTTPEEAEAIMINAVRAELESTEAGTIGAAVATLSTAIANEEEARSTSVETLYSTMEGEFEATATAFNTINTYIGIDEAGASTGTGLSGYLEGTDGQIGSAGSKLINDVALKAGEVENKFAYNSTVTLNGVAHTSGFGLATSINSASIPEGDSQFWVSANEFKVVGANQTADAQGPFTVNTTTGDITFRGKVTFNSGQIGTIDEAIAQVVETVSVGDKNINITDNLIPTTSLVADTNNSGYQFVGSPVKSNTAGFSSFAEPQISMIVSDEVYSLYVDEMTIPYYYRFAIKGLVNNADLNKFKIVTVDSSTVVTYSTVIATMSEALVGTEWYEIDGIINPVGGDTAVASGSIRKSDGTKIGTINNFALPSGSVKLLLGWYGECIISRMKLAKITADTLTGNYVTQDYVDESLDNKVGLATLEDLATKLGYLSYEDLALKASLGQTIITGGYLRTGLIEASAITSDLIDAYAIAGKYITGGNIYGTRIDGAYITGSIIKSSFIDLSSSTTLSNWKHYKVSSSPLVPVEYFGNFAHNNDGSLLADIEGYARLPATTGYLTTPVVGYADGRSYGQSHRIRRYFEILNVNKRINVHSWNSYQISTLDRSAYEITNLEYVQGLAKFTIVGRMFHGVDTYWNVTGKFKIMEDVFVVSYFFELGKDNMYRYRYIINKNSITVANYTRQAFSENPNFTFPNYSSSSKGVSCTITSTAFDGSSSSVNSSSFNCVVTIDLDGITTLPSTFAYNDYIGFDEFIGDFFNYDDGSGSNIYGGFTVDLPVLRVQ